LFDHVGDPVVEMGRLDPRTGIRLLGVHHVRDDLGGPLSWDIGFLIFGVLLIAGGWTLHKAGLRTLERRALTTR
jgi:uncharacterized membrane protein